MSLQGFYQAYEDLANRTGVYRAMRREIVSMHNVCAMLHIKFCTIVFAQQWVCRLNERSMPQHESVRHYANIYSKSLAKG